MSAPLSNAPSYPAPEIRTSDLSTLLATRALRAHYQPIVQLHDGRIHGFESLIRGPPDSNLAMPDALFEMARRCDLLAPLEIECIRTALQQWAHHQAAGKLFINISASVLTAALASSRLEAGFEYLKEIGIGPKSIVLELTEHERIGEIDHVRSALDLLRLHGAQLTLDDFGDGRSSLRVWSELKPDYVKIDKYFTRGVSQDADKVQTFRALLQIAETFGAELVAEGIESDADLRALRDLGVRYGQGWFLGRPAPAPVLEPPAAALKVIQSYAVAVVPELRAAPGRHVNVAQLVTHAQTVGPDTCNDELFKMIAKDDSLHAIAVVQDQRPLAIIGRHQFLNWYARPFYKELFGRRSCMLKANQDPVLVEIRAGFEKLAAVLTRDDQRYLQEGIIITENGRYCGLGTAHALIKIVTEARIETARHANPLTLLPGNIPINRHIDLLLASGATFAAAYADLNQFKAYNDLFGYRRGDEVIRLAANVIGANADARSDFIGHIGGDDFLILFQSKDWMRRCECIVQEFNERAAELAASDIPAVRESQESAHGADDRRAVTMSIGIVNVNTENRGSAEEVSAAAATAKRIAKQQPTGLHVLECQAIAWNQLAERTK